MANIKLKEENTIQQLTYWRDKFDEWLKNPSMVVKLESEGHHDEALGYHTSYGTIKFAVNWRD